MASPPRPCRQRRGRLCLPHRRLPAPGDEKTAASYAQLPGGGFNMMVAAAAHRHDGGLRRPASARARTATILRAAFAAEGIDALTPPISGMDSGNCVVLVTARLPSAPSSHGRAPRASSAPPISCHVQPTPGDWVFTSGYTLSYPGSRDAWPAGSRHCRQRPLRLRPDRHCRAKFRATFSAVLARTNWLSCNRAEAAVIAGLGTDEELASRLLAGIARRPQAWSSGLARPARFWRQRGSRPVFSSLPGRGSRHQWRRRHPYRRLRQRALPGRATVRGGALRQRGGCHLGHAARRLVGADRRRDQWISCAVPGKRIPPERNAREARHASEKQRGTHDACTDYSQ